MRDFFEHQDQARASTRRLVFLFILAIMATVAGVYVVTVLILGGLRTGEEDGRWVIHLWTPLVLLYAGGATVGLVTLGGLAKTAS